MRAMMRPGARRARRVTVAAGVLAASVLSAGRLEAQWQVVNLPTLYGTGSNLSVGSVNATGQVVGYGQNGSGARQGFLTGPNGTGITGIGFLDNTGSFLRTEAFGLNDAGQVAGTGVDAAGRFQAVITGPNGTALRGLGYLTSTLTDETESFGRAVNESGQVVGLSTDTDGNRQAFITDANGGTMRGLGFLGNGCGCGESFANDIDVLGRVVGGSSYDGGFLQAFITGPNGAAMRGLGFLNASPSFFSVSEAFGINDDGFVVGTSSSDDGGSNLRLQAFVTGANGTGMTGLGFLDANSKSSQAKAINNLGQIVGYDVDAQGVSRGFIAEVNGAPMRSLDSWLAEQGLMGWNITEAVSINDNGWITAYGRHDQFTGGELTTLLIMNNVSTPTTPVSEPGTWVLLATALVGLTLVRRRSPLRTRPAM